ncbi:MAG: hypothetical protein V1685_04115 [Parcubacteria group bacterium]
MKRIAVFLIGAFFAVVLATIICVDIPQWPSKTIIEMLNDSLAIFGAILIILKCFRYALPKM